MLLPPDLIFFHVYHAAVHHTAWIYESPYTLLEFIALTRYFRIDGTDELLKEAAGVGLKPFFLLFLYVLQVKTAWHGLHIRRLILGGFEGGIGARLLRLRQMIKPAT
ncbi:MAG TPA: hypothetical protein PK836_10150 [Syntrophales bacterium]|nr:hypothetical protein [Syntrophales bacterium]HPC02022.1 hypothetical protein [Syntrophales bacterium]HRS87987.1 hypothetical protein [Syntrophales bacterium]